MSWGEFEQAAPGLAAAGRRLFDRDGIGQGLLATVRDDLAPRIHPIWFAIVDGRLYAFILRSAKRADLERDGRFALHNHVDPAAPSEFSIRGRARAVDDEAVRSAVAADWAFEPDDAYRLFELGVEAAVLGYAGRPGRLAAAVRHVEPRGARDQATDGRPMRAASRRASRPTPNRVDDAWLRCQSEPRKYRPGTSLAPPAWRGKPGSSRIGSSIQP